MNSLSHRSGRKRDRGRAGRLLLSTWALLLFSSACCTTARGTEVPAAAVTSRGLALSFAIADFDGDTLPDLASVQTGHSNSALTDYRIEIELSTAGRQTFLVVAPAGGLQVAVRDVNGDHAPDLVLTTTWFQQPIAVYINDGHGTFTRVDARAFPGAFAESQMQWSPASCGVAKSACCLQRPRPETRSETGRYANAPQQLGGVPSTNSEFVSLRVLVSHLGRAPPFLIVLTQEP